MYSVKASASYHLCDLIIHSTLINKKYFRMFQLLEFKCEYSKQFFNFCSATFAQKKKKKIMNSSVFSVAAGTSLNFYNVSATNLIGMSFDVQTNISSMNIGLLTKVILMSSMLNIHPSIADSTAPSPTWLLTSSLNTAYLVTPTFVTNSTERNFNLTSTEILQVFSSTMKQVSSVASPTLTPTTVDVETSNPLLKWFLQFDLSGKIEMPFVEDLKNPNSKEFANLSALIITEVSLFLIFILFLALIYQMQIKFFIDINRSPALNCP